MLTLERHGDVTRVHLESRRGRLAGYSVSLYDVRGQIVDTGFSRAARDVEAYVDATRPHGVILTHYHEDHAGNVELLARRGVPILAAESTLAALRADERIGISRRFTWGTMPRLRAEIIPFVPDGLLFVHTGAHSPDHHVVWDPETRTLFSADLYLGVKVRIANPSEDLRALARVLREIASLAPRRMFDAHRGAIPDPVNALLAKADWLDETIAAVDRLLDAGQSDKAILRDVLGGESLAGFLSRPDYSRLNFVRGLRATRASPASSPTPAPSPAPS